MTTDIIILDFEDSFTLNIASFYYCQGMSVCVIPFKNILDFLQKHSFSKKTILIYGPGPGHPRDYAFLFPVISDLLKHPFIFHFGICLGHQLLWSLLGFSCHRSVKAAHGQTVPFRVPKWDCFSSSFWGKEVLVQRYNSLVIDHRASCELGREVAFASGESMASFGKRWLTYQFHPESVATQSSHLWLLPPTLQEF